MRSRDLSAWTRHGTKAMEMAWATPQVIAHRTLRMLTSGAQPNARDRREFTRMGQEKLDAIGESMLAMNLQFWRGQQHAASALWQAWWRWCAAPMATNLQAPWLAWQTTALRAMSGLVGSGMKPVHRRVTANAKRLARVKLTPSRT